MLSVLGAGDQRMLKEEAESSQPSLSRIREEHTALSLPCFPLPSPTGGVLKTRSSPLSSKFLLVHAM